MSNKIQFGLCLKQHVRKKTDTKLIGTWCHSFYCELPGNEDPELLKLLVHLGTMELGHEFAFTYEELAQIADDLIAGKDVKL